MRVAEIRNDAPQRNLVCAEAPRRGKEVSFAHHSHKRSGGGWLGKLVLSGRAALVEKRQELV